MVSPYVITFGEVSFTQPNAAVPKTDPALREENKALRTDLGRAVEVLDRISKKPLTYAHIIKVSGNRVVISMGGRKMEIETPPGMILRAGDTVRCVPETGGIHSVVLDPMKTGGIVTLKAIIDDNHGEIDFGGMSRSIALAATAKQGDRVVLNETGELAISILGPAPNECAFGETTGVIWDDIGGLNAAKASMKEAIEGPYKNKKQHSRFGKKPTRGILLYGPPGCGKTMLGKAAATAVAELHGAKAKGGFFYVKGPELLNMYVGATEQNIRKLFDDARKHEKANGFPAVLFIDEADAVLGTRSGRGYGMEKTTVPQFLSEMDGLESSGAIVILATNRPNSLDPAIVRDGRIDRRIRVTRPEKLDAIAIARSAFKGKPVENKKLAEKLVDHLFDPELVVAEVRRKSAGQVSLTLAHTVNGAMIVGIVERATSNAMQRDADSINSYDVYEAVVQAFNEAIDVNHDEELFELCGDVDDVVSVRKGTTLTYGPQTTAEVA